MKRFFVLLIIPVCFIALMSCKSGGKSEIEGINMSNLNSPLIQEFLPDNCRPDPNKYGIEQLRISDFDGKKSITGYGSLNLTSSVDSRAVQFVILPDTCKDVIDNNEQYTSSTNTAAVELTGRKFISNNLDTSLFFDRDRLITRESVAGRVNWCGADKDYVSQYYKKIDDEKENSYSSYQEADLCNQFVLDLQKQNRLSEEAVNFFKQVSGRTAVVGYSFIQTESDKDKFNYIPRRGSDSGLSYDLYKGRLDRTNKNLGLIFIIPNVNKEGKIKSIATYSVLYSYAYNVE